MPTLNSASNAGTVTTLDPDYVMSKDEYWDEYKKDFYTREKNGTYYDGIIKAPDDYNDLNYRIAKFFGRGGESSFEAAYEAYLNNMNNKNEAKASQSAKAWDEYMDNTKYARTFKDLQNAGINPYILINGGASPSTSVGSATKPSYKASHGSTKDSSSKNVGRDFALVLLAIARLAAVL